MADLKQLETALVNAHNAGDVDAARILAAEIQRQRTAAPAAAPAGAASAPRAALPKQPSAPIDPTEGMSTTDKLLAGAGKAFADLGRGTGQLARQVIETISPPETTLGTLGPSKKPGLADRLGLPTQADIDDAKRLDAPLMNTKAGTVGNIGGNIALAAPAMLAPGANTVAGGAIIGGITSALQPVATGESRAKNVAIGAGLGGAIPASIRAGQVGKAALIEPFTEKGRDLIVGRLLNKASSDSDAAVQNMQTRTGTTPGFQPTVGQAADDAGLASLERGARAIDPAGFGNVDKTQRGALVDALRGIAKTPEDRAAAVAQVESNARKLYGEAFKENIEVTPALTRLARRPSVQAAEKRAIKLADEVGMPFNARLEDMQPRSVYAGMRDLPESSVIESQPRYNNLTLTTHNVDVPVSVPSGTTPTFVDIPPVESVPVRDMHTLKMGMDALLSDPTTGIAGREAAALKATRNKLLDQLPESYQVARRSHVEMNRPVNQMDIGKELYNRFVPALADGADTPFKSRADAFAQALRNGDKLAKNVTGLKNATLEGIMEPEQMATLRGVVDDAAMIGNAQNAGRGVGSDSVQKLSMSNLIDQSGLPSWIGNFAPLRPAGGWLKTAGDILYSKNDETMRHLLADVLKDPARATQTMKAAGVPPSRYADVLRAATQAGAVGAGETLSK